MNYKPKALPNASTATVTDPANITLHAPTVANPNLVAQSNQSVEEERGLPLSAMVVVLEVELQISLSSILGWLVHFSFTHNAFFLFLSSFTFCVGHVKEVAAHEDKELAVLESNEIWSRKVQKGDTLWHLSEKYLGDGTKWPYLQSACDLDQDPRRLQPGRPITNTCVTRAKEDARVVDSFTC